MINRSQPSLRLLLVVTFGGVALALVTLLSLIVGQISTAQVEADARSSLVMVAAEMAGRLQREITERYREIVLIAATNETLQTPNASIARQSALLEKVQDIHPDYAWIGVANTSGTVIIATDDQLVGKNVATLPWFRAGAIAPFIGNLHEALLLAELLSIRPRTDEPLRVIDFAAPIVAESGHVVGVLGAQLNWEWARQFEQTLLDLIPAAEAVEIFVVDQDGTMLLAPPGWSAAPFDLATLQTQQRSGALVATWPDGQRYVTGYATVQENEPLAGLEWTVLVRQPVEAAYAPAWRTQWQIFAAGALFATLFALATWWLASRITRQLVVLTQAAERIRHGEGSSIPVLTGTAEVASLSTSLNQLIADLTTATVAERNRIARELHDSVTQTLFSTSMLADVLPQVWEADPEKGREKLEELRRAVRGALAEMRTLLLELRPSAIADADMQQLLRQLADSTSGRTNINVTWRIEGNPELPPARKVVLYRIMQEALHNMVKHAQADHAQLVLRNSERMLELVIIDDGIGFEPATVSGDHLGLAIMRERVEASGGQLVVVSHPDEGTEIHALWNGH
ncbi:MAG: HAMP domain-containing protein [Caldilineaceae bacterium]|nr:HAMP domain-containing protein [Caldilineaceae bacterium]